MTYDLNGHLFEREDDGAALKRLEAAVVAARYRYHRNRAATKG